MFIMEGTIMASESEPREESSEEMKEFWKKLGTVAAIGALSAVTEYLVRGALTGTAPKFLAANVPIDASPQQKSS